MTNPMILNQTLLGADEGERFSMFGVHIRPRATATDTLGAYDLLEQVVEPGGGSPPHILHDADKVIYVADGEFMILLGDAPVRAAAGATAIIPRGVVHSFKNVGAGRGRLLITVSPAGHAAFLRDLAAISAAGRPPFETMQAVARQHGVEILPPKQAA
jgi:mannose-6-phosphate isomerase-like protein (cupin superfamily)